MDRHVLIGHSHGGNVILYALKELGKDVPEKLKVVTLSTPFIVCTKRSFNAATALFPLILPWIGGLYYILAVLGAISILISLFTLLSDFTWAAAGQLLLAAIGTSFIYAIGTLWTGLGQAAEDIEYKSERHVTTMQNHQGMIAPTLIVTMKYDEAYHALQMVRTATEWPFLIIKVINGILSFFGDKRVLISLCVFLVAQVYIEELTSLPGEQIFYVTVGFFICLIVLLFVWMAIALVIASIFRSHFLSFGKQDFIMALAVNVKFTKKPITNSNTTSIHVGWRNGFQHSIPYSDAEIIKKIGDWVIHHEWALKPGTVIM